MVKNLPAVQETQVWPLGWEDLLEKEIATHSNILAWEIPWIEEPGRLQSMGVANELDMTWWLNSSSHPMVSQGGSAVNIEVIYRRWNDPEFRWKNIHGALDTVMPIRGLWIGITVVILIDTGNWVPFMYQACSHIILTIIFYLQLTAKETDSAVE